MIVDPVPLRKFTDDLQTELTRFEELLLRDLDELAHGLPWRSASAILPWCDQMYGIRQCSILYRDQNRAEEHIRVPGFPPELLPEPKLMRANEGTNGNRNIMPIPYEQVFRSSPGSIPLYGWVGIGSSFVTYWFSVEQDVAVAFVVDRRVIAERTQQQLLKWVKMPYAPVPADVGLHRVEGPGGVLLAGLDSPPRRPPDYTQTIQSRVGQWQILSWDVFKPSITYHIPTLAVSAVLGTILTGFGVMLFVRQQKAFQLAEQRVTFVNRASHELGAPLTNILLNLDLAQETITNHPEESARRIKIVKEESHRLARLVSNILTFSRIERSALKINPTQCVPDEMIAHVLQQFDATLALHGIEIRQSGQILEQLMLDGDALTQIIANLVSNVEKYASDGRRLEVESAFVDGYLTIRVGDQGRGIPAEAAERIFKPFERVSEQVNEGTTGTGLGLTIARDLAHGMGGSLRLLPSDCGSLFEVRIPTQPFIQPKTSGQL